MAITAPTGIEPLLLDFLAYLEFERGLSRNTLEAYRSDLLQYGAWLSAVSWSAVKDVKAEDQTFRGKVLIFQVHTPTGGIEKRNVPLSKLADGDDAVLEVVGRYYNRYLNAVAFQSQSAAS